MRWAGACRSQIELLSRDWHSDFFSLSYLDGNQFTIYIMIRVFGGPNIQVSQNVVMSTLEAL
jgi:hypothetical protein